MTSTTIILGAPIFGNSPNGSLHAPIGQVELCKVVRRETNDPVEISRALMTEYFALGFALQELGIAFKVVMPRSRLMESGIPDMVTRAGFETIPFPETKDLTSLTFPRDLVTVLPDGTVLIDSTLRSEKWIQQLSLPYKFSPYGQGGRIFLSQSLALVNDFWHYDHDPGLRREAETADLQAAGLTVVY